MTTGAPRVVDEIEVKFELAEGVALPDLGDVLPGGRLVGRPTVELGAVYYDTTSLTLLGLGVTLRRRHEVGGGVDWTLKVPASDGGVALRRSELSWPGAVEQVPADAGRVLAGLTRGRPLVAVAGVRTVRRRCDLLDAGGRKLAEIADDEVSVDGVEGVAEPELRRFRQIEVELDGGDVELVPGIQKVMRAAGARRSQDRPKLAEALGVASRPPRLPGLRRRAGIGEVTGWVDRRAVHQLERRDLALRLGDDAEVVHQARVACRRARADLGTLAPLLDEAWVRDARAELRWLGHLLGDVRDADVLASRLAHRAEDARAADRAGFDALSRRQASHRDAAQGRLRAGLADDRYVELLQRLEAAAASPPWRVDRLGAWQVPPKRAARSLLRPLVRRQWRVLARRVASLPAEPSAAELHEVRIRTKRLRYAAELARPVCGAKAGRLAKRAVALQDTLGAHQDAVAAEEWLRAAVGDARRPAGPAEAFVVGQLVAAERADQAALRAGWARDWKALRKTARKRWPA